MKRPEMMMVSANHTLVRRIERRICLKDKVVWNENHDLFERSVPSNDSE